MARSASICFMILGLTGVSKEVSTKLDFDEITSPVVANSSKEDDDVEVKHTIIVSTKLKNNNRRGLVTNDEGGITYRFDQQKPIKEDSGEVPIVKAFKSVETTQIRTPDSRIKSTAFPEFVTFRSSARDDYDLYPLSVNPLQWKPSAFYNNINWYPDGNYMRRKPEYHRRMTDDGAREFYCKRCRELGGPRGCFQQRRNSWVYETTTSKIKIDGKLAKLN